MVCSLYHKTEAEIFLGRKPAKKRQAAENEPFLCACGSVFVIDW